MKEIEIRSATQDDAAAIARIHIDSWRSAYRGLVPDSFLDALDYEARAQRLRESLGRSSAEWYLAEGRGELLGFVALDVCRDEDVDPKTTGEIQAIYLAPQHWRKGTGGLLYRHAERILRERGYRQAVLWVFAGNDQARRFYEAMGFAPDGASKTHMVGAPLEAVRYAKRLRGHEPLSSNPSVEIRP
jgi:GNAT superfamily N-acetyltransferase